MTAESLGRLAEFYRGALLEDVVPFWQRHGVDRECGGFFTCVDRRGVLYSTDKPVWFQGRATWLYATLYERVERRPEWLDLARHGADFLARHCFDAQGKMYFLVDRRGAPLRMRRYAFSEVFATLAYIALARATGAEEWSARAVDLFGRFRRYVETPGLIPPKVNPQVRPMKSLSPLMCLLNLADELARLPSAAAAAAEYELLIDRCCDEIERDFVDDERRCVLETVGPQGQRVAGPDGRTMNPGHVLECAWFMLAVARRRNDTRRVAPALRMIDYALERGWDDEHGGLLYFVDVEGRPPVQLEHDLKLWWPHNEALIATLLAWRMTGADRYAAWFQRLHEWSFGHFADGEFGEWFGYLHRDGRVSTPLKGGLWKGPFHLPRALLLCAELLREL